MVFDGMVFDDMVFDDMLYNLINLLVFLTMKFNPVTNLSTEPALKFQLTT